MSIDERKFRKRQERKRKTSDNASRERLLDVGKKTKSRLAGSSIIVNNDENSLDTRRLRHCHTVITRTVAYPLAGPARSHSTHEASRLGTKGPAGDREKRGKKRERNLGGTVRHRSATERGWASSSCRRARSPRCAAEMIRAACPSESVTSLSPGGYDVVPAKIRERRKRREIVRNPVECG